MAGVKKKVNNNISQKELGNELLLEDSVEKKKHDGAIESVDGSVLTEDTFSQAKQIMKAVEEGFADLRSHERNYVAANKRAHEAIVSVCFAKTGKRVTLSVKQLKKLIDYGKKDWLDIKYSDSTNTVLIGKSEGAYGVVPIANEKKYIIYDSLTVKDFKDTLYLDFGNCSSHSAYSYKMVQLNGRPYIALSHSDFI